jgi:hypothetical protein
LGLGIIVILFLVYVLFLRENDAYFQQNGPDFVNALSRMSLYSADLLRRLFYLGNCRRFYGW